MDKLYVFERRREKLERRFQLGYLLLGSRNDKRNRWVVT